VADSALYLLALMSLPLLLILTNTHKVRHEKKKLSRTVTNSTAVAFSPCTL
jgi:hypothetical protein